MTLPHQPLVSILTPVYNGARYLRDCIESVLAQTYGNWDYTIVNNCSTDQTLAIAREYAVRDSRIKIYTNEKFVRAIENHNIAFRQISPESKYCKVVAADDWLFPECVEKMVRVAEEHSSVAIIGAYGLRTDGRHGAEVQWAGVLPYPGAVVSGREACRWRLLGGNYIFGTPTSVLFRSAIVRGRHSFYNESNLHADSQACFEALENHDFGFVHQILTVRRDREGSLSSLSEELNTYLPNTLTELITYGARYLSEAELTHRIRHQLRAYYRYLGTQVPKRRGRQFWSFHRGKLAALGFPMNRARLAAHVACYGLDMILNPKSTAQRAVRRLRLVSVASFSSKTL